MSLGKYFEQKAPSESWWIGKNRSAFGAALEVERPRLQAIGARPATPFAQPGDTRMSRPNSRQREETR